MDELNPKGFSAQFPSAREGYTAYLVHPSRFNYLYPYHGPYTRTVLAAEVFATKLEAEIALQEYREFIKEHPDRDNDNLAERLTRASIVPSETLPLDVERHVYRSTR